MASGERRLGVHLKRRVLEDVAAARHQDEERRQRSRILRSALPLLPAVIYLLLFYGYPLVDLAGRSVGAPEYTTAYYTRFFQTPSHVDVLVRTLVIAALGTVSCIVLAYPLAYLLAHARRRARAFLMIAIIAPWLTSSLVRTFAWVLLLGRRGPINEGLLGLGILEQPLEIIGTPVAVYIGLVHVHLPLAVFPMYAVMRRIDDRLTLVAQGAGATPAKAFLHVYLPLSLPGVAGAGVLLFISQLGFYITPLLLGGPGDLFIANLMDMHVRALINWEFAAALGFILFGTTVVLFLIYSRFLGLDQLVGGSDE